MDLEEAVQDDLLAEFNLFSILQPELDSSQLGKPDATKEESPGPPKHLHREELKTSQNIASS